jgi:hypothetical protein
LFQKVDKPTAEFAGKLAYAYPHFLDYLRYIPAARILVRNLVMDNTTFIQTSELFIVLVG